MKFLVGSNQKQINISKHIYKDFKAFQLFKEQAGETLERAEESMSETSKRAEVTEELRKELAHMKVLMRRRSIEIEEL